MAEDTFSVSQVAKIVGIAPNTVRDWTRKFEIDAQSEEDAERRYTSEHVAIFRTVKVLRDQGEPMKRVKPRIAQGERLEPPDTTADPPQDEPAADPGPSAMLSECEMKLSTSYARLEGEFDTVKLERDYLRGQVDELRDAHLKAEIRAVKAETERDILR